jgi:Rps23 Pro-64 3,4-dihydroxylase Tpa1-like proline 4-hydroxylase
MFMRTLIDFERFERELTQLSSKYRHASPFEHVIVDEFLTSNAIKAIREEGHYSRASTTEKSSDFLFAKNKIENPKIEDISPLMQQLREELLSNEFSRLVSEIVGTKIFIDPNFSGGGLHQGGAGSFLDMHADFTRHPMQSDWIRELNILLYLNPGYEAHWGGQLDLENLHTGVKSSIEPIENRLVLMLTKSHTLHGYKPITFPAQRYRTSIAAYAYSLDDGLRDVPYLSTSWRPANPLKRLFAKVLNPVVVAKQRFLGSKTAKRAERNSISKDMDRHL